MSSRSFFAAIQNTHVGQTTPLKVHYTSGKHKKWIGRLVRNIIIETQSKDPISLFTYTKTHDSSSETFFLKRKQVKLWYDKPPQATSVCHLTTGDEYVPDKIPKDQIILGTCSFTPQEWMQCIIAKDPLKHPITPKLLMPQDFFKHVCNTFLLSRSCVRGIWENARITLVEKKKILQETVLQRPGNYGFALTEEFQKNKKEIQSIVTRAFDEIATHDGAIALLEKEAKLFSRKSRWQFFYPFVLIHPIFFFQEKWKKFAKNNFSIYFDIKVIRISFSNLTPLFYSAFLNMLTTYNLDFVAERERADRFWKLKKVELIEKFTNEVMERVIEMSEEFIDQINKVEEKKRIEQFKKLTGVDLLSQ